MTNEFIRSPYQFVEKTPPWVPRWGLEHKRFMRTAYRYHMSVGGPVQELPLWDSRIELDPKAKDYWGIPVARISGPKHPHTVEIARFIAGKCELWLKEAGATRVWSSMPGIKSTSGGQHQAGTCRMGNDPMTSVVDRYCRVHDFDNLFVIDASVHVTNGSFNPALTIMAVAYYAADHIVKNRKETGART
jgi:choline dehydrogenase-like flavoprotein